MILGDISTRAPLARGLVPRRLGCRSLTHWDPYEALRLTVTVFAGLLRTPAPPVPDTG